MTNFIYEYEGTEPEFLIAQLKRDMDYYEKEAERQIMQIHKGSPYAFPFAIIFAGHVEAKQRIVNYLKRGQAASK